MLDTSSEPSVLSEPGGRLASGISERADKAPAASGNKISHLLDYGVATALSGSEAEQ